MLIAAESYSAAPLGYAAYRAMGDEAEFLRLAVAPAARRRGIARALLTAGRCHLAGFGCGRQDACEHKDQSL